MSGTARTLHTHTHTHSVHMCFHGDKFTTGIIVQDMNLCGCFPAIVPTRHADLVHTHVYSCSMAFRSVSACCALCLQDSRAVQITACLYKLCVWERHFPGVPTLHLSLPTSWHLWVLSHSEPTDSEWVLPSAVSRPADSRCVSPLHYHFLPCFSIPYSFLLGLGGLPCVVIAGSTGVDLLTITITTPLVHNYGSKVLIARYTVYMYFLYFHLWLACCKHVILCTK